MTKHAMANDPVHSGHTTTASALSALGESPLLTLTDANDANASVSVRLVRAGGVWLGVVDDSAALLDRVRVGGTPRFVAVDASGAWALVCGDASVKLRGRAADRASFKTGEERAHKALVDDQPFGVGAAVVIEVAPLSFARESAEQPRGALPRT